MYKQIFCLLLVTLICSFTKGQSVEYHAVIAGIDLYRPIENNLNWAVKDAEDMKSTFETYQGWQEVNIELRTNTSVTLGQLQLDLTNMARTTGKTNLFFFAGHGSQYGLLTYDENWQISLSPYVLEQCVGYNGFNQYTAILDACASEVFVNEMSTGVILAACETDESASEGIVGDNGTFTHFLLSGLTDNAADQGDGLLSAEELFAYASWRTTNSDPFMHPKLGDNYTGDLVLNYNLFLFVPQQYATILSALSAANSGQTIVINSGTYNENLTISNKNDITIRGQGAASTIINGSLSASYCNNLKITSLRLNSLSATYCNLGNFYNNINSGGMSFYSCTGFNQYGTITG